MNQELQDNLYKKYPKLFGQKDLPMQQTAMCWGICVGDGWYRIIEKACGLIQWHVDQSRRNRAMALAYNRRLQKAIDGNTADLSRFYDKLYRDKTQIPNRVKEEIEKKCFRPVNEALPQIQFTQIKEKFGRLRMYTTCCDNYIDGVIAMTESMSGITCEECGKPGKLRGGGWSYTACVEHTKKEDLYRNEEEEEEV